DGVTPLMMACDRGNIAIVKLLLTNGANVKVKDNNHWTPLQIANQHGFTEIASLLKQAGAKE
ncbi:MAG: ankyrin repeat domain-containing protein, partial [Elusimicrobiaceae bacterium]